MIQKQNSIKVILSFLALAIMIILFSNNVYAYKSLCLTEGQSVPSDDDPRYTCDHDLCQICVTDNNYPGISPSRCNDIAGCFPLGGDNSGLDITPPELTINSPVNDHIYNARKVIFNLETDEIASFHYTDNINGRGQFSNLAGNTQSYNKEISLKEGLNNITIRAKDSNDNYADVIRVFRIDSQSPKIKKFEIDNQGKFMVSFTEDNPTELSFNYGNSNSGFESIAFNIANECESENGVMDCEKTISNSEYTNLLSNYDGQSVNYWFELEDVAGNRVMSKTTNILVDVSLPVINDIMFTVNGKSVEFILDINEVNLESVEYIDLNDPKGKFAKLCSKLVNNKCIKKVSFKEGDHQVSIKANDKFGNSVAEGVAFFTDSKKPKIKKFEIDNQGKFMVSFTEDNPTELSFNYGNLDSGFRNFEFNIPNECVLGNPGVMDCEKTMSGNDYLSLISDYDSETMQYWFELQDRAGMTAVSKKLEQDVDITPPVINNINYTISGKNVEFMVEITETNLESVSYLDLSDPNPKSKVMCSKLNNGMCKKKISLKTGTHLISIQASDKFGNAVSESVNIVL